MNDARYGKIYDCLFHDGSILEEFRYLNRQAKFLAGSIRFGAGVISERPAWPENIKKEELEYVLAMEVLKMFNDELEDVLSNHKAKAH